MSSTKRDQFTYKITSCDFIKALGLNGTWVKDLSIDTRTFEEEGITLHGKVITVVTTSRTRDLNKKSKSKSKKRKYKSRK